MKLQAKTGNRLLFPVMFTYVRWTNILHQKNDNMPKLKINPLLPQTRDRYPISTKVYTPAGLILSNQDLAEKSHVFRGPPGPTRKKECYNTCATALNSTLRSQSSIFDLFRGEHSSTSICEMTKSAISIFGLLYTFFCISQASKGSTTDSLRDNHML